MESGVSFKSVFPFSEAGRFYRGNIHCHSNHSDGGNTPEWVINSYKERGYDFLCLTDHLLPYSFFRKEGEGYIPVIDTREFSTDDFLMIPGAETHGPGPMETGFWHFVAVGLPVDFAHPVDGEDGGTTARRAYEAGAFVALAHPRGLMVSESDVLSVIDHIHAFEVYNHIGQERGGAGEAFQQAEVMTLKGYRRGYMAADDAHFRENIGLYTGAFGGWVQVRAEELTEQAIVSALKAGSYYSSTGPEIESIELDGCRVRVRASSFSRVVLSGRGSEGAYAEIVEGREITFDAPFLEKAPYFNVTVFDRNGKKAWTNPFFFEGR